MPTCRVAEGVFREAGGNHNRIAATCASRSFEDNESISHRSSTVLIQDVWRSPFDVASRRRKDETRVRPHGAHY
jgi:hypothetical protein